MLRILDRLNRSLTWRLLSPVSNLPNGIEHRASDEHAALLGALQAAREQGFGVAERSLNVDERAADSRASHFLAVDHRGQIVGAVRLFVVDRRREPLTARLLVGFGRITFPSPADEMRHLAALERWLASTTQESMFVYAGGFFTTGRWRGSGLAVVLGMAAIAMARLHGSRHSASFASTQDHALLLFDLLGARPLEEAPGRALEPFAVPRFDIPVRAMTFDSLQPDPSIEAGVQAMVGQMRRMKALAPPPRGESFATQVAAPSALSAAGAP